MNLIEKNGQRITKLSTDDYFLDAAESLTVAFQVAEASNTVPRVEMYGRTVSAGLDNWEDDLALVPMTVEDIRFDRDELVFKMTAVQPCAPAVAIVTW